MKVLISIVLDLKQFAIYSKIFTFQKTAKQSHFFLKILKFLDFSNFFHISLTETKFP